MDISASDIAKWKTCPRQAVSLHNLARMSASGPRRVGQAAHHVAAQYMEHLVEKGLEHDFLTARDLMNATAAELSAEDEADFRSFMDEECIDDMDATMLTGAQQVQIETRMHICMQCKVQVKPLTDPAHAGHDTFSFTPDIWWVDADGFLHVWDWKSGHVIQHVDHPDEQFQLDMYLGALMFLTGISAGYVHLFHMRHSKHEQSGWAGPDQPYTPKLAQWLIPRWETQVKVALDGMKKAALEHFQHGDDDYGAVYGSHCHTCDVRGACATHQERLTSMHEDAPLPMLLADVMNWDAAAKDGKARLKAALTSTETGVVTSTEHEAYLSTTERSADWDPKCFEKLKEFLPETDLMYVYQPTRTRLEKVLKKHKMADMVEALESEFKHATLSTDLKMRRVVKRQEKSESPPTDSPESSNSGPSSIG